jgi:hypothetical protein
MRVTYPHRTHEDVLWPKDGISPFLANLDERTPWTIGGEIPEAGSYHHLPTLAALLISLLRPARHLARRPVCSSPPADSPSGAR